MIIDYFNCEAYSRFFYYAPIPADRYRRDTYFTNAVNHNHYKSATTGGPIATRYITFHDQKTRLEKKTVPERGGLFGLRTIYRDVEYSAEYIDYEHKAVEPCVMFPVLGTLFHGDRSTTDTGVFEIVDYYDKAKTLLFDTLTGLPCIIRQPSNMKEIEMLLRADPRFIAFIDPAIVRAEQSKWNGSTEFKDAILAAAQAGLDRILTSQAALGVVFTEEEKIERREFVEEATKAMQTFIVNYEEMSAGAYDLSLNLQNPTSGDNTVEIVTNTDPTITTPVADSGTDTPEAE